jgi:hypothetical protein
VLEVVAGTPAASPVEPDLDALGYENYYVLALIDVPALDTTISDAQITNRRRLIGDWGSAWGVIAKAEYTSNSAQFTAATDIMLVAWTAISGRKYKICANFEMVSLTGVDVYVGNIRTAASGGGTAKKRDTGELPNNISETRHVEVIEEGLSGAQTRYMSASRASGASNLQMSAASTFPAQMWIEDMGPSRP